MRFFAVDPKDKRCVRETTGPGDYPVVARFFGDEAEKAAEDYAYALNNEEEAKMGDDL